jgi:hypothetical protein
MHHKHHRHHMHHGHRPPGHPNARSREAAPMGHCPGPHRVNVARARLFCGEASMSLVWVHWPRPEVPVFIRYRALCAFQACQTVTLRELLTSLRVREAGGGSVNSVKSVSLAGALRP